MIACRQLALQSPPQLAAQTVRLRHSTGRFLPISCSGVNMMEEGSQRLASARPREPYGRLEQVVLHGRREVSPNGQPALASI